MGSRRLYDWLDRNPLVEMHPVSYTNNPAVIAQNRGMVAVNAALEVDLLGQVCADTLGTNQYSGVGGQVDFVRGARLAEGGRAIIVLTSTARDDGQISRITPMLKPGAVVTTSRNDVDYIVTEYGAAQAPRQNRARADARARSTSRTRNSGKNWSGLRTRSTECVGKGRAFACPPKVLQLLAQQRRERVRLGVEPGRGGQIHAARDEQAGQQRGRQHAATGTRGPRPARAQERSRGHAGGRSHQARVAPVFAVAMDAQAQEVDDGSTEDVPVPAPCSAAAFRRSRPRRGRQLEFGQDAVMVGVAAHAVRIGRRARRPG